MSGCGGLLAALALALTLCALVDRLLDDVDVCMVSYRYRKMKRVKACVVDV